VYPFAIEPGTVAQHDTGVQISFPPEGFFGENAKFWTVALS
jgi:hypothetical protein